TIRIAASLGSLAISDYEPHGPKHDSEYDAALLAERNALRKCLCLGTRLKAVLNPPRRYAQGMMPDRMKARYARMIKLLQGQTDSPDGTDEARQDLQAIQQCEFTLSPVPMPNMFIIGDLVAYEGMKRAGIGGYEMTHVESDPTAVSELVRRFDEHYNDSQDDLLRTHPRVDRIMHLLITFEKEASMLERKRRKAARGKPSTL
ncbi:MAG: hypothetical protein ACRD3S_12205, partial [Terracidiphilus sp.]